MESKLKVIDLYCNPDLEKEVVEWMEASKFSPKRTGKFKVKLFNGTIINAYYLDVEGWISSIYDSSSPITYWGRFE